MVTLCVENFSWFWKRHHFKYPPLYQSTEQFYLFPSPSYPSPCDPESLIFLLSLQFCLFQNIIQLETYSTQTFYFTTRTQIFSVSFHCLIVYFVLLLNNIPLYNFSLFTHPVFGGYSYSCYKYLCKGIFVVMFLTHVCVF